jgi:hypothetical protein
MHPHLYYQRNTPDKRKSTMQRTNPRIDITTLTKRLLLAFPYKDVEELNQLLKYNGYNVSDFLVATIRSSFREDLKLVLGRRLSEIEPIKDALPHWFEIPKDRPIDDRPFYYRWD